MANYPNSITTAISADAPRRRHRHLHHRPSVSTTALALLLALNAATVATLIAARTIDPAFARRCCRHPFAATITTSSFSTIELRLAARRLAARRAPPTRHVGKWECEPGRRAVRYAAHGAQRTQPTPTGPVYAGRGLMRWRSD